MPGKNFYYRLNNFLILIVIVFVGMVLYSKVNVAHSQNSDPITSIGDFIQNLSRPAYVINREVSVDMDPNSYTAHFVSDGFSGKPSSEQKSKFFNEEGGSGALDLINTPLDFQLTKDSKLILPGEIVSPAVPKGTAPSDYQCVDKGALGDDENNRRNCLFSVTDLSVFTDMQTQSVVLGSQQYTIVPTSNDYFVNLTDTLKSALTNFKEKIVKNVGLPDQSREAVGTIRFWGDDSFQQFVPISGGGQSRQPILIVQGITETTGNNIDEGLFATDFSPGIDTNINQRYKSTNIIEVALCPSSSDGSDTPPLFADRNPICGPAQIFEPFTSLGTTPKPPTITPTPGAQSNIDRVIANLNDIADSFSQIVTQNNPIFQQKQQRLSAQNSIRVIEETTKFSLKYGLCEALEQDKNEDGSKKFNYESYKNIYADSSGKCPSQFIIDPVSLLPKINPNYSPNCEKYENLKRSNPSLTRCFTGIAKHISEESAVKCVKAQIENNQGCDELSVEEGNLNISQMEKAFPLGLAVYFQNSTLEYLDPSNTQGPYINYLSPYFCAKLNLAYTVKPGASYIYDAGTQNGNSGKVKDKNGKFVQSDFVNQYCVLGGVMSVFAYANKQTAATHYSTTNFNAVKNLPKEALTCDKKETAYFGAVAVKTNIDYTREKPIYITDDNTRDANQTRDEVAVYQGYNAYPLTDILKDPALQGKNMIKYGNMDMQVIIDPVDEKPKYVVLSIQLVKSQKKSEQRTGLFLCKFPSIKNQYGEKKEKSLCKQIYVGGFLYPKSVAMIDNVIQLRNGRTRNVETITVTYSQPQGEDSKEAWPYAYQYIDVLDEFDMAKSIVSDSFAFNRRFTANIDTTITPGGQIIVAGMNRGKDSMDLIGASVLDPMPGDKVEYVQNDDGSDVVNVKRQANEREITGNLCEISNYCSILNSMGYDNSLKVDYDPTTGRAYIVTISAGFGVVYYADINGAQRMITPKVFAYQNKTQRFTDGYDDISAMKIAVPGELHIFLGRSGMFLDVFDAAQILNQDIKSKILKDCGTNCMLTVQKEFNPSTFTTDCTNYDGSGPGSCGYPEMDKIGAPIVSSFVYDPNGRIRAWYTHSGLDKTLLQSPDMLYAFSHVYSKVGDSEKEYSSVYMAKPGQVSLDNNKSVNGVVPEAIRYFNWQNGGLNVGKELVEANGLIKENLNSGINDLPNYEVKRMQEKIDCINRMNTLVSGIDLYYTNSGLVPVNVNPSSQTSTPTSPVTGGGPSDGSGSSVNPGEFCEEKWCVADIYGFANNPRFKNDKNETARKQRIIDFLTNRVAPSRRDAARVEYTTKVNYICTVSDEFGIPCTFLVGLWFQESGASLDYSPAFNCFNGTTSFNDQVRCAAATVFNRYNEFQKGTVTISGPSDRVGKPYLTNANRGGGSCKAATAFSYVMNKYTPLDKRINNDNQCNTSLVTRPGQDDYCRTRTFCSGGRCNPAALPNSASRDASGTSILPTIWADATATRGDLQYLLLNVGEDRLGDLKSDKCYPATNPGTPNSQIDPTENQDIQKTLTAYDLQKTQTVGTMKIDLKNWGQDDAAGNIYMLLNVNIKKAISDWNNLKPEERNDPEKFDPASYFDNKGIQGAYIVQPGQSWSFNDQIGNPSGDFIEDVVLKKIMPNTKAPWNSGVFNYDANQRCITRNKDGTTSINTGCGWCEMGSTVRIAAERLVSNDNKTLAQDRFSGAAAVSANTTYGLGSGWKGDINHWSHSGVSVSTYNALVPNGVRGMDDASKYVSIVTRPGNSAGLNDGDLLLKNPYPQDSGIDMIITIEQTNDGIVTVQLYFGQKAVTSPTGPN